MAPRDVGRGPPEMWVVAPPWLGVTILQDWRLETPLDVGHCSPGMWVVRMWVTAPGGWGSWCPLTPPWPWVAVPRGSRFPAALSHGSPWPRVGGTQLVAPWTWVAVPRGSGSLLPTEEVCGPHRSGSRLHVSVGHGSHGHGSEPPMGVGHHSLWPCAMGPTDKGNGSHRGGWLLPMDMGWWTPRREVVGPTDVGGGSLRRDWMKMGRGG